MTSDINGTVTGLQGNAVSSASPTDGYVLTWDATDGYWVARPVIQSGLRKDYFTSSGTWTAPAGVTNVLLIGTGGGGGGAGGGHASVAGGGGGGSLQQIINAAVTPGISYNIVIGSGGSGGTIGSNGSDGDTTIFKNGSIIIFSALGGGAGSSNGFGGLSFATGGIFAASYNPTPAPFLPGIGYGAPNNYNIALPSSGFCNNGFIGGTSGSQNGGNGGGGGGAGPQGNGANGSNGVTLGTPANGSSAAANTGAGGGGGGAGGTGSSGGNGGSGYLYVIY